MVLGTIGSLYAASHRSTVFLVMAFWQILCLTFDEWLFRSLNAPLADSTTWRYIWTIGSLRPFDIVVG